MVTMRSQLGRSRRDRFTVNSANSAFAGSFGMETPVYRKGKRRLEADQSRSLLTDRPLHDVGGLVAGPCAPIRDRTLRRAPQRREQGGGSRLDDGDAVVAQARIVLGGAVGEEIELALLGFGRRRQHLLLH